jgi:glycosyltransferase involved in cell wall biosynthesis
VAHSGWGEALFLKDLLPGVPLLNYCEFYYHGTGADVGFAADQTAGLDAICRARARNAHLLLSLESCNRGLSPTRWQRDSHPAPLRDKIEVIFDGIDLARIDAAGPGGFALADGRALTKADTVVTYVARNFEPYRGFPPFMRAVPEILRRCPRAQVVIVGGDGISYGRGPGDGQTWRQRMLEEVGPLDPARVHFPGRLGYDAFLALLGVSTAHVYLTVPFVLSWSCLEAMARGCLVIGSRTPPVEEVIADGENGLLVGFDDPAAIAARVAEAIERRDDFAPLRARARRTIEERYALAHCLPAQLRLLGAMA